MSAIHHNPRDQAPAVRARLEQIIARFEEACQRGECPRIESYLPAEAAERWTVLIELVHTELECLLKAGQAVQVEDYLQRFPELAAASEMVLELLAAEYELRLRREPALTPEEYQRRFPQYAAQLPDALARSAGPVERPVPGADTWNHSTRISRIDRLAQVPIADAARASLPGYEILEELGRGGMGVVYKARQLQLQRLVALKMILTGDQADAEQLERFRTEAQAVACLAHPHIVQIYEIGEQDGRPYFSLEYVDGGSLDKRLAGQPQPPEQAARLVETLARAMQAAHQENIIHRDLKPGNVLLTADGTPKITDFGLAKRLDVDSGQTRTGAVLGTPSYMAPEQAVGHIREIGPVTDVYALGAILYELLTGRPPFRGATVLDTLEQVRTQEPIPPVKLQPKVPHDLETICLKCLAKEPSRRYGSALLLAQDLERFRAGEPILGRRERLAGRLWRKVRRNRLVTTAVLAGIAAVLVAGYFAPRAYEDRRRAVLLSEIETGLHAPELTLPYLERMETLLADLEPLALEPAGKARQRLHQVFAEQVRAAFRERLVPEEIPRIESALGWLASREPSLAEAVAQEFARRRTDWQPLLVLAPPFDQLDTVFDAAQCRLERRPNNALLGRAAQQGSVPASTTVAARPFLAGNIKLRAVYDRSWTTAEQLDWGLQDSQGNGYGFSLQVVGVETLFGSSPERSVRTAFATAARAGHSLMLRITRRQGRQSRTLAVQWVEAADFMVEGPADGSLQVELTREQERLTFQLNRCQPLEFRDTVPLDPSTTGTLRLAWPEAVCLRSLHGYHRPNPAVPSVLERGDALYNQGNYEQALQEYHLAFQQAEQGVVRQEGRYKEGLCLLALKRETAARAVFQAVAAETEPAPTAAGRPCWSLLADCQLLLSYHREKTPAARTQADAVLERLVLREGDLAGEVAARIPYPERQDLVAERVEGNWAFLARKPEEVVQACERARKLARWFAPDQSQRLELQVRLVRAYRLAERQLEAMQVLSAALRDLREDTFQSSCSGEHLLREYCWLVRRRSNGQASDLHGALKELDRWLFQSPGVVRRKGERSTYTLLLERARLHAALQRDDQAARDLEQFFREEQQEAAPRYGWHAEACLLQGFLRERRGDAAGAQAAWRAGLWKTWTQQYAKVPRTQADEMSSSGVFVVYHFLLAALAGELTDREAENALLELFRTAGSVGGRDGDLLVAQAFSLLNLRAEVFRQMWLSPRGREWGRRIAFRELSFAEYMRVPMFLFAAEFAHQDALPGPLAPEQEELIWQCVQEVYQAALSGAIPRSHLLVLGSLWKGVSIPGLGWPAISGRWRPALRGSMAYLFGHRCLRLRKPAEARQFFRIALADAPPASPLQRLAQMELDRSKEPRP